MLKVQDGSGAVDFQGYLKLMRHFRTAKQNAQVVAEEAAVKQTAFSRLEVSQFREIYSQSAERRKAKGLTGLNFGNLRDLLRKALKVLIHTPWSQFFRGYTHYISVPSLYTHVSSQAGDLEPVAQRTLSHVTSMCTTNATAHFYCLCCDPSMVHQFRFPIIPNRDLSHTNLATFPISPIVATRTAHEIPVVIPPPKGMRSVTRM